MPTPELDPVKYAYQEIPERWYEKVGPYFPYLSSASALTCYFAYNHFIGTVSLETVILGSGLYLASAIADRISTIKAMDAHNRALKEGMKSDHRESNILMRNIKTSASLMHDPVGYAIDLGGLGLSSLNLGVAVSFSALRGIATLNNLRVAQRFNRAVQIANLSK